MSSNKINFMLCTNRLRSRYTSTHTHTHTHIMPFPERSPLLRPYVRPTPTPKIRRKAETLVRCRRPNRTDVTSERELSYVTHEQEISTRPTHSHTSNGRETHVRPKGLDIRPGERVAIRLSDTSFGGEFKLGSGSIRCSPKRFLQRQFAKFGLR